MTDIINKIVWQTPDNDKSWVYALCPTQGVNMVNFQVQTGWQATDGLPRTTTPAERAEVARRLVACWNACEGLDTHFIEHVEKQRISNKLLDYSALVRQREKLLKALDHIEKWDQHTIEFALDWGSRGVCDLYRGIARDAIAACQPAPPVVPLPANDTKGGDL
jgi:hypothetical protein